MQDDQGPITPNLSETTPLTSFSQNVEKKNKQKLSQKTHPDKTQTFSKISGFYHFICFYIFISFAFF